MKPLYSTKMALLIAIFLGLISGLRAQTTFSFTGTQQTFTVPPGVSMISVDMQGATGGPDYYGSSYGTPGPGGRVQCLMAVSSGQVLNVYVGGAGQTVGCYCTSAGGYNGGGMGNYYSGGGGGATDIRTGGIAYVNRQVVAGGGGGVDYNWTGSGGAGGGLVGGNGTSSLSSSYLGTGGTQTTYGTCSVSSSCNGAFGVGGNYGCCYAGGGGAGWYGGGGSYEGGGGGGGSSYTNPSLVPASSVQHTQGFNSSGNGVCIISIPPPGGSISPACLAFGNQVVGTTSAPQSVALNFFNLSPASGNLSVTPPAGFLISVDGGTTYTSSAANLAYTGGGSTASIYVEFQPTGYSTISDVVTVSGGGIPGTLSFCVGGTGVFPCTGTPTGGSATVAPGVGIATTPFTLSLAGATLGGGVTYQWQSSAASTYGFTNISGATTATYNFTGISATTYYQCVITCPGSGLSGTSSVATATLGIPPTPCTTPRSSNTLCCGFTCGPVRLTGESGTSIADLTGMTATRWYYDQTVVPMMVTLDMGKTYTAAVGAAAGNSNSAQIWIDFNSNGIFETSESVGGTTAWTSGATNVVMTIPALGVTPGTYRMRVVVDYGTSCNANYPCYPNVVPCMTTTVQYGETRDYGVVLQGPPCAGTPAGGSVTASTMGACNTFSSVLSYVPASIASGLTYQWQSSPDNSTWTAVSGATNSVYNATVSGNIYYNMQVTCSNSGLFNNSASINLNLLTVPTPIAGPNPVCMPAPSAMTSSPSGGTWASSNLSVASVGLGSGIVNGITTGTTNIIYTLPDGCSATRMVSVAPAPVAIIGSGRVCQGLSTSAFYDGSAGGQWTSSNIAVATIGTGTGIANGVSSGSANIIYTLPSGCSVSSPFTVNPLPASIVGPANVCTGASVTMTDASSGGTWLSTSFNASVGAVSGIVTGLSIGSTNIVYTLPTGCTMSFPVTVNALPDPITATSTNVCVGANLTLSETSSGGSWSSTDLSLATVNSTTGVVTGVSAGNPTIVYTLGSGCTATTGIVVNPLPPMNTVTVTNGGYYCTGGSGVHIGLNGSTAGINYDLWNSSGDLLELPGASSALDFGAYSVPDAYTVIATNPTTSCSRTMSGTANVMVSALPGVFTVGGGGTNCAGGAGVDVNMSGSETGVLYQLYNGSIPSGSPVAGTGTTTLDFGLEAPAGTYTVSAVNSTTGCVNYMNGSATVTTGPVMNIYAVTGGGNYCTGTTTGADVQLSGSDMGVTYTLMVGSTSLPAVTSLLGGPIDFGSQITTGAYTVVASLSGTTCTRNMSGSATVGTLPLPAVYALTGGGNYCAGTSGSHIGLAYSATGVNYKLYNSGGLVNTVPGSFSGLDFGSFTTPDTYYATAIDAATGCTSNMTGSTVVGINALPTPYNVSTGGSFCAGGSGVDVNLSSSDNSVNYQLYNGSTAVGIPMAGIASTMLDFGNKTAPGTYTILATNPVTTCSAWMTGSSVISVNSLPIPYNVMGGGNYCVGGTGAAINLNNSEAGVTYNVIYAGGTVGSHLSTGGAVSLGNYTGAGNYTVQGIVGTCMTEMNGSVNVGTNPLPAVYPVTGGGSYCSGTSGVHVGLGVTNTGISYQVLLGGIAAGLPVGGTGFTYDFGYKTAPGVYQVLATNTTTGCSDTMTGNAVVTVNTSPSPYTVIHGGAYCAGTGGVDVSLSNSDYSVKYKLYLGSTWVANLFGNGAALSFGNQMVAGIYSIVGTDTATNCSLNMSGTTTVVVDPIPNPYTVGGGGNYCASSTVGVPVTLGGSAPGIQYVLKLGTTAVYSVSGTGSAISFPPVLTAGTYSVQGINISTGCPGNMSGTVNVGTIPTVTPAVTVSTGMGDVVCAGAPVTFTAVTTNGGTSPTYAWTVNGSPRGTTSGTYSYMPLSSDVVAVTMTSSAVCPFPATASDAQTITVNVNQVPTVAVSTPNTNVCAGNAVTLNSAITNGGTSPSYSWNVNGSPVGSDPSYTYTPNDGDVVFLVMGSNFPCRTANTVTSNDEVFSVLSPVTPVFTISSDPGVNINKGDQVTFTVNMLNTINSASIAWNINNGPVVSTTSFFVASNLHNNDTVKCTVTSLAPLTCGDASTTNKVIMSVSSLGVNNQVNRASDLVVLPNPNNGSFTVKGSLAVAADQQVTLEITNMLGQVVYNGQVMAKGGLIDEKIQLNGNVANGMYILNVHAEGGNSTFHFVVGQ